MKLARSTISVCFNYSTGFSKCKIKISEVIVQIYKLSHRALGTKLKFAKFKHDRLPIALPVNQNKLSYWNLREKERRFYGVTFLSCLWRNALS